MFVLGCFYFNLPFFFFFFPSLTSQIKIALTPLNGSLSLARDLYWPVQPCLFVVEADDATEPWLEDPGRFVVVRDSEPPLFSDCPASQVIIMMMMVMMMCM